MKLTEEQLEDLRKYKDLWSLTLREEELLGTIDALKSEHAAQLQAALWKLREDAANVKIPYRNEENGVLSCSSIPGWVKTAILDIPIPTAALETALDKKQTETITACASAVCEGCRNNWMLAHGAHQTPHQGEWFPCKADAIWALSPVKVAAALERTIAEARLSEAKTQHDHFFAIDTGYTMHERHPAAYSCIRLSEAQAALDAAKAKESK